MQMNDAVFVIAEAGVNHNGSLDLALRLVDAAADAGADAVKFQFKAGNLVTARAPKAGYQQTATASTESQLEMLRRLELGRAEHETLVRHCAERGIEFISTPFDQESLALLVDLGVGRIKISSGELTNAPLLHRAARHGLPLILSTGMASLEEVRAALGVLAHGFGTSLTPSGIGDFHAAGAMLPGALTEKVSVLHCTSEYPAPVGDTNLRAMETLRATFGLPAGLSDHTEGITVAIAAAARGAAIIEKHMTLDRRLPGPDHQASLDPATFGRMVAAIREVQLALGDGIKRPATSELANLALVRKSLVATRPIARGEPFSEENLAAKRPGGGVSPMCFWDILGRPAPRDYQSDEAITIP
jgi:N-acetylneuraminate synthase